MPGGRSCVCWGIVRHQRPLTAVSHMSKLMVADITLPRMGYSYGSRDGTRSRSGPCTNGNRPSKKDKVSHAPIKGTIIFLTRKKMLSREELTIYSRPVGNYMTMNSQHNFTFHSAFGPLAALMAPRHPAKRSFLFAILRATSTHQSSSRVLSILSGQTKFIISHTFFFESSH